MIGRKFRIQSLLVIASLLFVGTATILFYFAATLSDSPGRNFLWIGLALAVTLSLAATRLGRSLSQNLQRLRTELPDLARGDLSEPQIRSRLAELDALSAAIGRLTQEVRARERATELERSTISGLLEAGTEGLLRVSETARIVHLNSAARHLLGLPADARGQSISTLIRQAELRDLIVRSVAGEIVEPRELTLEDRQLIVTCKPLPGLGAVVAILDFTDIRRLEAVRRDFVGNVSHELKTPLTSIRGYAETLLNDDLPPELREQFLEVIYKNTVRIQHIVDELLDLTRLQSGGWTPNIRVVDAAELAEDVWSGCSGAAKKHISFDIAAKGATKVAADPEGLRQVLSNLFDNAIRYTPEGGNVSIRILPFVNGASASSGQHQQIELQVRDTGAGIPRESLPRIFERFYRADPARSRADGGTGLGLSIVKHLVERMAGEVSAESELGKGTTIRLRLPAA